MVRVAPRVGPVDLPQSAPRRDGGPRSAAGYVVAAVLALAAGLLGAGYSTGLVGSGPAAELSADLLDRFDRAARVAAGEGQDLVITSGLRTADEQQALLDDAVATYGSYEEARRWVMPPERSAHVAGTAIDVGPASGAAWLGERGTEFGLCRVYDNEPWHVEPLADPGGTCPPTVPDAADAGASG